jgi:lipopolysaccharide heptosyltransferase II
MEPLPHTTLIIRFSSVGDIVLSSLLVRAFHNRIPGCRIDVLVKREYADLVRYSPHVGRVIEFPTGGSFRDLWRLRKTLRRERYDLVLDIHDSLRSRFLCFGLNNVRRIRKRKIARFLLLRIKLDLYGLFGGAPSIALRYLEPAAGYGVTDDGGGLELHLPLEAEAAVDAALGKTGAQQSSRFVGLCPSARHRTKIWPADRFSEAAARLGRDLDAAVLLLGGMEDRDRCAEVEEAIRRIDPARTVVNLCGQLSLVASAAAIDRCMLIVTNDSGLMHIAAARRRPVIAIFGSTVYQFGFFPFGTRHEVVEQNDLACRPCTAIGRANCPKDHFRCMLDISVDQVVTAAHRLLAV